jgi:CheY-like chemotaxis protein
VVIFFAIGEFWEPNQLMTILYVEDDLEDQELFQEAIQTVAPHTVCHFANNGTDAFKIMDRIVIAPDYIFLDINMPEMNGKDFLKTLKSTSGLKSIPVIIYSTSNREQDIIDCKKLGAVDFISKPNTFTRICEVLKNFL